VVRPMRVRKSCHVGIVGRLIRRGDVENASWLRIVIRIVRLLIGKSTSVSVLRVDMLFILLYQGIIMLGNNKQEYCNSPEMVRISDLR
jgi:hypothetical protein